MSGLWVTYEEFKKNEYEKAKKELNGDHPVCQTCKGLGEYECDCCGADIECRDCDSVGYFSKNDPNPSPSVYFKECIKTVKKLASYKNSDLIDEAIGFIKFYNKQGLNRFNGFRR